MGGMKIGKYPYTLKPSSLEKLLREIQSMGVPTKINTRTLPTMGYKAKSDRALLTITEIHRLSRCQGCSYKELQRFPKQTDFQISNG